MRIATKGILAVKCEPVKQLRPPSTEWASVFCGGQKTLPVTDESTREGAVRPRRVFCRTVRPENTPQGTAQMRI